MLYKRSKFERKIYRFATGSPLQFIVFIVLGLSLFLYLTMTIEIDEIKTFSAQVIPAEGKVSLSIKTEGVSAGPAFIYSNRNEAVYPVTIEGVEKNGENITLIFSSASQTIIKSLSSSQNIFVDIPQGKATLLYLIFFKGGKERE